MLKKILAGVIAAVMTFSMPIISFGQETVEIDCELSNSEVEVGDVFYADFKITDNPTGYNNMQCFINFDASKLRAMECEVDDIPNNLIIYTDSKGVNYSLFSFVNVNSRVNFVPKSGDQDYLGMADSKTKAGDLGRIKLANLLNDSVDGVPVNYTGTGILLRMKFKAIASGTSEITMTEVLGGYTDKQGPHKLAFNVNNNSVTIAGGDTETTTSKPDTTEVTTASSGNNSSSSSGGSSSGTAATTTTEAYVEATTSTVIGGSDNETDISVISFTDVEKEFWAHDFIIGLATKGVVNGYPDGSFRPQNNVTRADFLIMLLRSLGYDTYNEIAYKDNFTDVEAGAYYAVACGMAKQLGIATGNPDGTFAPASYITRQDMMILAKKALENKLGSEITGNTDVLNKFNDKAEISAYAVESLAAMVDAGIVNGKGENIAPKDNTTRAESATIISMIMDYINK